MKKFRYLVLFMSVVLSCSFFSLPAGAVETDGFDTVYDAIYNFDLYEQELVFQRNCDGREAATASEYSEINTDYIGSDLNRINDLKERIISYATHQVKISSNVEEVRIDADDYNIGFNFCNEYSDAKLESDNTLLFSHKSDNFTTGVKVFPHSVRYYTVINSNEAPKTYSMHLDMPEGFHLQKPTDFQGNEDDGSMLILKADNSIAGFIDAPLAFDADGVAVPIELQISGNDFTYTYDIHADYTTFPVTSVTPFSAESDWLAYYKPWPTESRGWVENYDPTFGRSLCFYQNGWAATWLSSAQKTARWDALYNYFGADWQWYNTDGMKDQWTCHVNWGITVNNSEWNLEPGRPLGASIFNLCNPS